MKVPRMEGILELEQDSAGRYRVAGGGWRRFETLLVGRSPLEAVYLTQQIGGDSGVSHALTAARAWEAAGGLAVEENGLRLRELLHLLSFLHAHLRQFYFQILPDYLPLSALGEYGGSMLSAARTGRGIASRGSHGWAQEPFAHRFSDKERDLLAEHLVGSIHVLALLQRAMAIVGGKFPMVMSIVPGGMSTRLDGAAVLRLETLLNAVEPFLAETALEDGLILLDRHEPIRHQGKGLPHFLSMGSASLIPGQHTGLFPEGVYLNGRMQTLGLPVTESIRAAYYRVAPAGEGGTAVVEAAPAKAGAYSWIKAPRIGGFAVETGPVARLVVAQLAGAHARAAGIADLLTGHLGLALGDTNTVGGRILAMLAEMGMIHRRCREVLSELDPEEPLRADSDDPFSVSGEGIATLEAPAGSVRHRMVLDNGKIVSYDIISPSTWNGSPRDESAQAGSLETALAESEPAGDPKRMRQHASRIVHAFAFSAADAVH